MRGLGSRLVDQVSAGSLLRIGGIRQCVRLLGLSRRYSRILTHSGAAVIVRGNGRHFVGDRPTVTSGAGVGARLVTLRGSFGFMSRKLPPTTSAIRDGDGRGCSRSSLV